MQGEGTDQEASNAWGAARASRTGVLELQGRAKGLPGRNKGSQDGNEEVKSKLPSKISRQNTQYFILNWLHGFLKSIKVAENT